MALILHILPTGHLMLWVVMGLIQQVPHDGQAMAANRLWFGYDMLSKQRLGEGMAETIISRSNFRKPQGVSGNYMTDTLSLCRHLEISFWSTQWSNREMTLDPELACSRIAVIELQNDGHVNEQSVEEILLSKSLGLWYL